MAQRTTRQWIINGILAVITLSFLSLSLAPMFGSLFSPSHSSETPHNTQDLSDSEKIQRQIEGFEAVLEREPKNQTALVGLVELRSQLGDVEGVLPPLQTLAEIHPEDPGYRLILARTYLQLEKQEAAINEYRTILTTKPGNIEALESLVSLELQNERPEAAIGILKDTLTTAETANKIEANTVDAPTVLWILGELYRTEERYAEALETYEQIAKQQPQDFRPLVGQAQIARASGNEAEAQSLFKEAVELAPAQLKDRINKIAAVPNQDASQDASQDTAVTDTDDASEPGVPE